MRLSVRRLTHTQALPFIFHILSIWRLAAYVGRCVRQSTPTRLALGMPAAQYPTAVRMTELVHETDRVVRQANVLCLKRLRRLALLQHFCLSYFLWVHSLFFETLKE